MRRSLLSLFALGVTLTLSGATFGHGNGHGHDHDQIEVSTFPAMPSVTLDVKPDPVDGYNLHVRTENFRWAPENVNGEDRSGEGHAHLYINGDKVARLYGPWYHLNGLEPGDSIRVTLSSNSHADLVRNGEPVAASREIKR